MAFGIDRPVVDNPPQDRDPIGAARRVSIDDEIQNVFRDEANLRLWEMRLASVLNFMDVARAQGEHQAWTSDHARQIRAIMEIGDAAVTGDSARAVVPQGFAVPIRTQLAKAFLQAQAAQPKKTNGDATDHAEGAAP